MTTTIDPALIERLSGEFTTLGRHMGALGHDLGLLRAQLLAGGSVAEGSEPKALGTPTPPPAGEQYVNVETSRPDSLPSTAPPETGAVEASPEMEAEKDTPVDSAVDRTGEKAPDSRAEAFAAAAATDPVPPQEFAPAWPGMPPRPPSPTGMPTGAWIPQQPYRPGYAGTVPPRYSAPSARAWSGAAPPAGGRPKPGSREPWWQRDGMISRVLAVAGVGVTLIGIVMLLVLAAQAGVFGPIPRVVAGAAFSVALIGVGARVYGRDGGRVGGIALAATGIAGVYLDVVAITAIYEWLHPVPGLAAALAVAAAGVGLSVRWRSQLLAVLVVAGAALLAPFVTLDLSLLAFLIVLQLAFLPVQFERDWPFLHLVRTVPAVVTALVICAIAAFDPFERDRLYLLLSATVALAVIGLVGTVAVVRRRPADLVATLTFAAAAAPLLLVPGLFGKPVTAVIAGGYAVVLLAPAVSPLVSKLRDIARIPGHTAGAAAVVAAFALLETCVQVTDFRTLPIALFLVALGFLGVGGQLLSRAAAGIGGAFAGLGGLFFLAQARPATLATSREAEWGLGPVTALAAVVGLGLVVVTVWAVRKLLRSAGQDAHGSAERVLWITAGAAALYLVTAAAVSIGTAAGTADGFVIGHSVATMIWMVAATGALLYGLRNPAAGVAGIALGGGLSVTTAALVKLFIFDLATLDGLIRVAAFLVVGILLLLVGTRYARAFAEVGGRNESSNGR
ncbi:DUF2339 domain-containing protein [Nocardia paucivorans]|uniref:DUF2339 domain-containing protein n=1 Tax=Nocardia paucivorans TaxID=114259 RepID=UPI000685CA51|nr:DUF2339 domain-containing protein [Nocardia paucivorans]